MRSARRSYPLAMITADTWRMCRDSFRTSRACSVVLHGRNMAMADLMELAEAGMSRQGSAATLLMPASTQRPESSIDPEKEPAARAASRADTTTAISPLADVLAYQRDVWERWVLFIDTLRQRADDLLAHDRAGKPPLLDFDYELILDARRFERPANYALLRITRVGDDCIEDCLDPSKPPVIVVDPRAGQGPGVGGFKRYSEVGIGLHEGYSVYFVAFFPEPCPGQTIADVLHALRGFVEEVAGRHSGSADPLRELPGRMGGYLARRRLRRSRWSNCLE